MDISYSISLAAMLCAQLRSQPHVILDASATERFSTPAAQLIVAAIKQATAGDKSIAIAGVSPAIASVFDDLGLSSTLAQLTQGARV